MKIANEFEGETGRAEARPTEVEELVAAEAGPGEGRCGSIAFPELGC